MAKAGRIPKRKWVVIPKSGGRIKSRHQSRSAAMDRALTAARKAGKEMVVCEVGIDARNGREALWPEWDTRMSKPTL